MPLIPLRPILEATNSAPCYAQGAFNVNAVCQAKAVIEAHEQFRSPAILQGADLANAFMGGRTDFINGTVQDKIAGAKNIAAAVRRFGEKSAIPIALHLDHGRDFESVKAAIDGGYTSVMIDGSSLPLEQNMELTREVVKYAHSLGVTVEGELGVLAGAEDDVRAERSTYTNPLRAVRECLLHEGLEAYLVSHGSSTVPQYIVDEINALGGNIRDARGIALSELKAAISCGIGKINVDTDIRLAVTRNLRELFAQKPALRASVSIGGVYALLEKKKEQFDPRAFLPPLMETVMHGAIPDEDVRAVCDCIERGVKEIVGVLIVEFGSAGRASAVKTKSLEEMAAFYRREGI